MRSLPVLVVAACVAATSVAHAQAPIEVSYDHVHSTVLDNGLTVVVVEAPALPIVTIEIAVRNGAFTEEPEFNGLSHLYEHMFFKANAEFDSQEAYMDRLRELGASWNGTTGDERVNYFFTLQSDRLREGLDFMNAAIRTPVFEPDELVREREVVLGEYDRNEADPGYHLFQAIDDLLWFEHRSRKDSLGDREAIGNATVEQMRWMQETYYIPNNSLLVLSGDVTADAGFAMAEEVFGDWASGPDPFEAYPIPEHPPLAEPVATVVEQPIGLSIVALAWHGPDTRNDVDATYAADVFSFALGQQSSGFQQRLVESGITLQAGIGYQTNRYTGPIRLTMAVAPGRELEAIEAALAEIERFDADDYVTDDQIAAAQTLLAVSDLYTQQAVDDLAHTMSYWWASADIDYYLGYVEALANVERAEMQRYVREYIQGQPMAVVLMSSPEHIASSGLTADDLLSAVAGTDDANEGGE